ncbi:S8 family serine peptidase [Virgibacillus byunsanensis]|uniref:S8 family serine peptidase n=1 Tax=Virgibacillus byunsanensis TaxID=570945 RepID=A0ABW3LES9_9BACI
MRLIFLILITAIIYISNPVPMAATTDNKQSIIIEVEGDPKEHKKYINTYHPFIDVIAMYDQLFNGLALQAAPDKLARMGSLEFIKAIHPVRTYETLPNDSLKEVQQDNMVMPFTLNDTTYTGKGVNVGVIDTGIAYDHPDLSTNYRGGYDLVDLDDDPLETQRSQGMPTIHGSHVAGIIAANGDLLGVAPGAGIYAYRALGPGGRGSTVQVIAAMEQAVKDGVDIINLSLGNAVNGPDFPTSVAVNRAVDLGIGVVIANGNNGPDNWTVGSPATATKAMSVGASASPQTVPYLYEPIQDKTIELTSMQGSIPWNLEHRYPIVQVNDNHANLTGKIALAKRGEVPFHEMAKKAEESGAEAVLIFNNEEKPFQGSIENPENPVTIPVASISHQDGQWLQNNTDSQTIETIYQTTETTIADFSSRGPVTVNWDIKPDIIAPGSNIISTVPNGYQALQGTSMAAPHVAGVMALVKEAHPDWTIEQIQGALTTTATPLEDNKGDLLDPIIQGTGQIQPNKAIETNTIIQHALLSYGKINSYKEEKTINVTIENTTNQAQSYSFDIPTKQKGLTWNLPQMFTLEGKQQKTIPIELSVTTPQLEKGLYQGWISLHQQGETYQLPYLFVNETADYPKAMGFEFSLMPFSDDTYFYKLYVTDEAKSVTVDLYNPGTLIYDRTFLELSDVEIGMNEGQMEKKELGKPGQYKALITVLLEDGSYESYETEVIIN